MAKLAISISGGGALGIGPLQFMCRLESDLGTKLTDQSIAFAGTSTGAIIAACLEEGMSAHEIFDLYKNNLKAIFTKYPWYKRLEPKCPTYDNTTLKDLLKKNLDGNIQKWKKPIFIPTTAMNGKSREKVWDLGDPKVEKWFAVLTSAAAPRYFDVIDRDGISYCDGGMWANDPVSCLQSGLKNMSFNKKYKILTFATCMMTPNTSRGNKTALGWGEYILEDWVATTGNANFFEARANVGYNNIFRASPEHPTKIKMDKTDDKTINHIIEVWDKYYDSVRDQVVKFVKE